MKTEEIVANRADNSDEFWFDVNTENGQYRIYLPQYKTDHIQRSIANQNAPYEAELLVHMERFIKPGELFVDIGANIGNHTLCMANFGARVVGYEANTLLTKSLEQSVDENSFGDQITIRSTALGSEKGHASFQEEMSENLGAQRLETGSGSIPVTTLDDEKFDGPVKLIKIDVEGMELEVLQGAKDRISKDRPAIYVGATTAENFAALAEWFKAIDYGLVGSFNATPTHLFLPEELQPADVKLTEFRDESARAVYYYFNALQNANNRLAESLVATERTSEQITKLRKTVEKHLKHRKTAEKYKTALLICALPVLILLLPVLIPYHFYRRSRKNLRGRQKTQLRTFAVESRVNADDLELPENNPLEVIEFLSKLDDPLVAKSEFTETVSVIVPSFNNAAYLELAVKSAVYQVGVNVEIIIIDDCSTDGSPSIAASLAERYPNVKFIPLLRNFGCYYARNIGLMEATGEYVTIVDSDDIMHPTRLLQQMDCLKKMKRLAVASQSQARRWTEDYSEGVSEVKTVENTLLFPRSVIDDIGFYDSVRYGGDSEFRERLIAHYGADSVVAIAQELYYLRSADQSLTEQSSAYEKKGQNLQTKLSFDRFLYVSEFKDWHHDCKVEKRAPFIEFPQTSRAFELGNAGQSASPSIGQEIIGGMATFPERKDVLKTTLPSILGQVDRLHIYLNGYEEVPDFLNHPKVYPLLGKNAEGDLRDNGKFFRLCEEDGYLFTFDDDIIYGKDYVTRMVAQIENFDRMAVVGVHGVIFPPEKSEYLDNRTVFHFRQQSSLHLVDLLGTGTTAYHSSTVKVSMGDFRSKGVCDLWFARLTHRQNVPMVSVARPNDWLTEVERSKGKTRLFDEAKHHGSEHTQHYHGHLYPLIADGLSRRKANAVLVDRFGADRLNFAGLG